MAVVIDWDLTEPPQRIDQTAAFRPGQVPTAAEINEYINLLISQGNYNTGWLTMVAEKLTNTLVPDINTQLRQITINTEGVPGLRYTLPEEVGGDTLLEAYDASSASWVTIKTGGAQVSNCILEMPTKPTYSGLNVTVHTGTKVSIPNGRNTDGTLKNTIHTVESDTTTSVSLNNTSMIVIDRNNTCFHILKNNILYADRLSNMPTTVSGTAYYFCYCEETNLWYVTTGSTTANWQRNTQFTIVATAIAGDSAITSLVPRDTLKFAQQEDITALTSSIINTTAEVDTLRTNTEASFTQVNKNLNETGNAVLLGDFISTYSSTENRLIPNLSDYKYIQFVWAMTADDNWVEPMISVELMKLLGLRHFSHTLSVPGGRGLFFQYVDNTHIKCYCPNGIIELKVYGIK